MNSGQKLRDDEIIDIVRRSTDDISDITLRETIKEECPGYEDKHIDELIKKGGAMRLEQFIAKGARRLITSKNFDDKKENKIKKILIFIFGKHFLRCILIAISVSIISARYFAHPYFYFNDQ